VADLHQPRALSCPHCWETITVWLDLSAGSQSYYEDCPVCCHPITISFEVADRELLSVAADAPD
jgi:hypothetical protein